MPMIDVFSPHLRESVLDQNKFRTSWVEHDTVEHLTKLYWEEDLEYQEAKEKCMIGADPIEFASEAGDKGYLYIKLMDIAKGEIPPEIEADIARTYAECVELGFDLFKAVFYKIMRNDIKYPLMFARNGFGFEGSQRLSKQQYKELGGDSMFNFAYMMLADDLFSE